MFAESLLFQLAVVERQTLGEIFAKVISPSLIRVDSSCDLSVSYPVSLQGMRFFFSGCRQQSVYISIFLRKFSM